MDENKKPILGTEIYFDCDTILLSVGLIPENELTRTAGISIDKRTNGAVVFEDMQTDADGIFACGNVLHVHDLVDYVTAESQLAGKSAAEFAVKGDKNGEIIAVENGDGQFMNFENLTFAPLDRAALDAVYMNEEDLARVNRYQKSVYEAVSPYLNEEECKWLEAECAEITKNM